MVVSDLGATVLQTGDEGELFVFLAIAFLGGLFGVYWGWTRYRRYTLIRDTPRSKIRSLAVGRTEVQGTATPVGEPLQAPFTHEPCLYTHWQVEEYRYDSEDNRHEWVTIASGDRTTQFYLEDETGRVLIRADRGGPDFDLSDDYQETIVVRGAETPPAPIRAFIEGDRDSWDLTELLQNPLEAVTDAISFDGRIGDTSNRRRYTQTILPVDHTVYVFGSAEPRSLSESATRRPGVNEDLLEVGPDAGTGLFIVSDRTEDRLTEYYSTMAPVGILGGLLVSAVALYFLLAWFGFG